MNSFDIFSASNFSSASRYYMLECKLKEYKMKGLFLSGNIIKVDKYGFVEIIYQDSKKTTVRIGTEERDFYAEEVGEVFFDESDPVLISQKIYSIKINNPTVADSLEKRKEIETNFINERISETIRIINKILQPEIQEDNRNMICTSVNDLMMTDFFSTVKNVPEISKKYAVTEESVKLIIRDYVKSWFSAFEDKIIQPDPEQLEAIIAREDNVEVIARAGSGKTATIVNRYRFLTEHCKVDPASVLILAFNKKAAEELSEKVKEIMTTQTGTQKNKPHIMTFHALAYSIVHPREKLIYDENDCNDLSRTVQGIIDDMIRDDYWGEKIRSIMTNCYTAEWYSIEKWGYNLSKENMLFYRFSFQKLTLNNEYVNNIEEKEIADFLFINDIDYEYIGNNIYNFDKEHTDAVFIIKKLHKKRIRIDYFDTYNNDNLQQETIYSDTVNIRIKVYKSHLSGGKNCFSKEIISIFDEIGVNHRILSEDEIWERIKERAIDQFSITIKTFVGRCRKKNYSVCDLKKLVDSYNTVTSEYKAFLEIATNIYNTYLNKLKQNGLEDFDGLILRAINFIENGRCDFDRNDNRGNLAGISYIMIDEYQDFSDLFDKLLYAVRNVCKSAKIFCVGDDWQAINAFAGSDVKYFQGFTERYDNAAKYYLKTNYRSKKEIVDISTKLMSNGEKNENILAHTSGKGNVLLAVVDDFKPSMEEKKEHEKDILTPMLLRIVSNLLNQNKKVVILTRVNDKLPMWFKNRVNAKGTESEKLLENLKSFFPKGIRENITTSTTHKYKGKEKDAVIILDATNKFYPHIHPMWQFMEIFGDTPQKLIEEEKRLFYVALSRAKNYLVIFTSKKTKSPFLSQLGDVDCLKWDDYSSYSCGQSNDRIELSGSTYDVREMIKKQKYFWDPNKRVWYRYLDANHIDIDINAIMDEEWVKHADDITIKRYNKENKEEFAFLLKGGVLSKLNSES